MAIKVGNSYVSEAGYAYAKVNAEKAQSGADTLQSLSEKFPNTNFSTNTAPFSGSGTNNIAISPNILRQMKNDPEKQLEYEALIYDCNSIQKSLAGQSSQTGENLVSQGFIINSNGTLSSWVVTKSEGGNAKSSCLLPKDDKKSWLTRMLENAKSDSSKPDKLGWRA